jgi:serine/threonine-protein kinase
MEYIQKHVIEPPIPLNERTPDKKFAKGLEDVLQKALQKKPDDRYQSAVEFAEALRPFGGAAAAAIPSIRSVANIVVERPGATSPQASRNPTMTARGPGTGLLVGVAFACLLVGVVLAFVVMRVFGR